MAYGARCTRFRQDRRPAADRHDDYLQHMGVESGLTAHTLRNL